MSHTRPTVAPSTTHSLFASFKAVLKQAPGEKDALLFEIVALLGASIMRLPGIGSALRMVGRASGRILEAISPAMPINISQHASFSRDPWGFYWEIIKYVFPMTVFFCLIMNALMTYLSGTLWGPSGSRIYYGRDLHNLALYLLVCPAYVSAAVCLVTTTAISWSKLNGYSNDAESKAGLHRFTNTTRFATFVVIAFLLTGVYIAEYLGDLADPGLTRELYWFFDQAKSEERILNKAGAYYLFMNAALLLITVMAALCYVAMSIEMVRLGGSIESSLFAITEGELAREGEAAIREREKRLKRELSDFSFCYIWAKILVLIYAVNIWIWQASPAGGVKNVHSAIAVLIVIGLFFLVVPRLYLASKWYRLKHTYSERWNELSKAAADDENEEPAYEELTSPTIRKIALVVDAGFVTMLAIILSHQYGFSDPLDALRAFWRYLTG